MDIYREALRATLARLKEVGTVDDLSDWCRRAGFKSSTVHEFLSGRTRSLTLEKIDALAVAAGVSVSVLLGEKPPILTKEDEGFISNIRAMSVEKKQRLLSMLRDAQMVEALPPPQEKPQMPQTNPSSLRQEI